MEVNNTGDLGPVTGYKDLLLLDDSSDSVSSVSSSSLSDSSGGEHRLIRSKNRTITHLKLSRHDSSEILGERVGAGKFKNVHKHKSSLGKVVLWAKSGCDSELEEEIALMLDLPDHENITSYDNDLLVIDGSLGVSADLGISLADARANGDLSERALWDALAGAAMGLHVLHESGIAHRDIKPSNLLLVNELGKLADFGCSKNEGEVCGTTGDMKYMSPEAYQAASRGPLHAEKENDLWGMGVTIFALAVEGRIVGDEPNVDNRLPNYIVLVMAKYKVFPGDFKHRAGALCHWSETLNSAPGMGRHLPPRAQMLVEGLTRVDPAARPSALRVHHAAKLIGDAS